MSTLLFVLLVMLAVQIDKYMDGGDRLNKIQFDFPSVSFERKCGSQKSKYFVIPIDYFSLYYVNC